MQWATEATCAVQLTTCCFSCFNPLEGRCNYSATSNDMQLVDWLLMGGLLHLVQRGGDWAGPQPAQAPARSLRVLLSQQISLGR